jgi:hypothetical protein
MRNSPVLQSQPSPAMTRLPPSPETPSALAGGRLVMPELSLDGTAPRSNVSNLPHSNATPAPTKGRTRPPDASGARLRSVAKYQSFRPQALACSDEILATSYSDAESSLDFGGPSSLGAIAGPRGVALFRSSRPHIPLLIFSHATNASSGNRQTTITSLAFRPAKTTADPGGSGRTNGGSGPLYLAAARGSGVLLWDASGRSSNPLVGRLAVGDGGTADPSSSVITSMSWKPSSGLPLLATTTPWALSLWDIRAHQSSGGFKPSLRFGAAKDLSPTHHPHGGPSSLRSPLVQVACSSRSDECATIDASGVVRIYDLRMTERGRASTGSPLAAFVAHEGGVGILHLEQWEGDESSGDATQRFPDFVSTAPPAIAGSAWVTWGLESLSSSAVVKVWADRSSALLVENLSNVSGDEDWDDVGGATGVGPAPGGPNVDGPLPASRPSSIATHHGGPDYHVIAKCSRSNLACARVCTAPVRNSLVVVGYAEGQQSLDGDGNVTGAPQTGWWAELLTLRPPALVSDEGGGEEQRPPDSRQNFGLTRVAKFDGGVGSANADTKSFLTVLGNTQVGRLQAAELAFSVARTSPAARADYGTDTAERSNGSGVELLLCSLTDTGVLTTHGIPEALPESSSARSVELRPMDAGPLRTLSGSTAARTSTQAAIYLDNNEGNSLGDVAGVWGGSHLGTGTEAPWPSGNDMARLSQRPASPQKSLQTEEPIRKSNRLTDGGPMPFHMEADTQQSVPVAYGAVSGGNMVNNIQIGITDMTSTGGSSSGHEEVEAHLRDSRSIMENIETDRVPCPRLCGATFGSGNGGLVIFKNGEVKKMWDWYQRTDTIRLSGVPGGQIDPTTASSSDPGSLVSTTAGTSLGLASSTSEPLKHAVSSAPRSLKELVDMMTTAKEVSVIFSIGKV